MLPLMSFLQLGDKLLQFPYGLIMADFAQNRYYFIVADNMLALPNRGLRLFSYYQTRDHASYGLVLDRNPFYMVYVMDLKSPILSTSRYYPQYPF
jgi:hypothetical protein